MPLSLRDACSGARAPYQNPRFPSPLLPDKPHQGSRDVPPQSRQDGQRRHCCWRHCLQPELCFINQTLTIRQPKWTVLQASAAKTYIPRKLGPSAGPFTGQDESGTVTETNSSAEWKNNNVSVYKIKNILFLLFGLVYFVFLHGRVKSSLCIFCFDLQKLLCRCFLFVM